MMDTVSQWAMVFQDMGGAPLKESSEDQKLLSQAMVIANMPLSPDNPVPQSSGRVEQVSCYQKGKNFQRITVAIPNLGGR